MIHLRSLPTVWSKSVLEFHKYPLSRSRLSGVLLKAGCTVSVPQLIRFLNVEESSRVASAEDSNKEVTKILSEFSKTVKNVDRMRKLGEEEQYEDASSTPKLRANASIESFRQFIKEADTQQLHSAMEVIHYLNSVLKSKVFPLKCIRRFENVESLILPNELTNVFETIERDLRFLSDMSLVQVLEACAILKISESSPLMQKLLKLLSSNINSMSSIHVLKIYCILKMEYSNSNQQVAALKTACSEFFKNCFETNLPPDAKATTLVYYFSLIYIPLNVKECMIKRMFESRKDLPFWSYSFILRGLLSPVVLSYNKLHKELLDYIIKEAPNLFGMSSSFSNMFFFLKSYKSGVSKGYIPYNESFVDTMASKILKHEPTLTHALALCEQLYHMNHFNYALFEYVASKAGNALSSGEFEKLKSFDFYLLTKVLSTAGKQGSKIVNNFYRERLEAAVSVYPKFEAFSIIPLALNLAILSIYDDRLIEQCFISKKRRELTVEDLSELNDTEQNSLLLLHQAIVTFHPSYQNPLLSEELMKKMSANNFVVSPTHNTWQEVVEKCFGGPNFVLKNCTTSLHHNLSYVVVLDKNNVPIDVTSIEGTRATDEPFNIANIPTSEESQVIVIQDVWNVSQVAFRNVFCYKGNFQLYMDVLEVYCNGVIPLFTSEFNSLMSYERVPYLLSKIEKKIGGLGRRMSDGCE